MAEGFETDGRRLIKQVRCPACGASKLTSSKTAYLYCDYCGDLIDWDFRIACESAGSALPGPAYEELAAQLKPTQDAALAAGDRDTYRETLLQLFDAHVTRWVEIAAPLAELYPERVDPSLPRRMAGSMFVQGWTPYLDDETCDALIERFGLTGEYVEPTPVDTRETRCGACGGALAVVEGAKRVVCEACGLYVDVGRGEIPCGSCGVRVCIPIDRARLSCPSCQAELRVDGGIPGITTA